MKKTTAICIIYFLVFCCTGAWLPKLYDFCLQQNLSGKQAALILSITPIMMFAVQPIYGFLADKLGFKKTLLLSTFLAALSYLLFLIPMSYWSLVMATIVMSLFYNTIQPILDSMALQIAESDKKFSYGALRFYGALGWAVTAIITGQLISAISINLIFVVSSVTMFMAFLCSFFLQNEIAQKNESSAYANIGEVLKNKQLLFLLFCVFLISVGATTIWNFYSTYLKENGGTDKLVGFGLSFQGLCELPLFYFSARIILKLGLKKTLLLTVAATVVRMLMYWSVKNPNAALGIELLHGFSWSLFWVACVEMVNKLVNSKWLATGQSLLYAAYFGAGAVVGNYYTEYFISKGKTIADLFLINAFLVGFVFALLLLFMKPHKS